MRTEATGFKVEYTRDIIAINATASSMAKETRGFSTIGTSKACSNRKSRENGCEDDMPKLVGRVCVLTRPICYRGRLWK